jgi:hypothetical protein
MEEHEMGICDAITPGYDYDQGKKLNFAQKTLLTFSFLFVDIDNYKQKVIKILTFKRLRKNSLILCCCSEKMGQCMKMTMQMLKKVNVKYNCQE